MKRLKDYILNSEELESGPEPWTMQGGYLQRINTIAFQRDTAYIEGDINKAYRATLSLASNVTPRLAIAGLNYGDLSTELLKFGGKLRSVLYNKNNNSALLEKNINLLEEELIILNTKLNQLIDESGLIFPKKEKKTIKELREADY